MTLRWVIAKLSKTADDLPTVFKELLEISDEMKEFCARTSLVRESEFLVEKLETLETLLTEVSFMKSSGQLPTAYARQIQVSDGKLVFRGQYFTVTIEAEGPRYIYSLTGTKFTKKINQYYRRLYDEFGWSKIEGHRFVDD